MPTDPLPKLTALERCTEEGITLYRETVQALRAEVEAALKQARAEEREQVLTAVERGFTAHHIRQLRQPAGREHEQRIRGMGGRSSSA